MMQYNLLKADGFPFKQSLIAVKLLFSSLSTENKRKDLIGRVEFADCGPGILKCTGKRFGYERSWAAEKNERRYVL